MISRKFQILLTKLLALAVFVAPLPLQAASVTSTSQQQESTSKKPGSEDFDSYLIHAFGDHSECREARAFERHLTVPREDDIGKPIQKPRVADDALTGPAPDNAATHLTIDFTELQQLQSDPQRTTVVAAFQRAAAIWTDRIKTPLTIRINIDYGFNTPSGQPFPDGILGSTNSPRHPVIYPGVRANLLAGSSGAAETALYNQLPASVVPTDVGNGAVINVTRSVGIALGLVAPSTQAVATISFNKDLLFDFNPDDGIGFNRYDFVAVAAHEIGHALGFTSGAGAGSTSTLNLWDIFRFRPGTTTGTFTTAERIMSIGGPQVYFTGQSFLVEGLSTNELQLSTGGPDPAITDGDGRQSSHWKDDTLTGKFIGIMDPTLDTGVHENVTENDFAALETIGWNLVASVAPPPAPPAPSPPANDNFVNAQAISTCSGSVAGVNIGATRESGEPNHSPDDGGGTKSVWYSWQAPRTGGVTITTTGSRFDTVLGIYTGSSVGSLSPVIQLDGSIGKDDDDNGGVDKTSTVIFSATAGTTYRIAVDGYDNASGGDFGPLTLNWTCAPPLQLSLDQSGPAADQASAFDSILFLRDPFLVDNATNLFYTLGDRNTRVLIFVDGLQLAGGAPPSAVTVNLVASNNVVHNIAAQDIRAVPNQPPNQALTQITFRLPDNLPAGVCRIKVVTASQVSNTATLRIKTN